MNILIVLWMLWCAEDAVLLGGHDATQITVIIGAVVSAVSHVVSEATADKAAVGKDDE